MQHQPPALVTHHTSGRASGTSVVLAGLCAAIVAFTTTGCGKGSLERATVSGTVTYQGQPIQAGQIRFMPTRESPVPMSGCYIVDGKYRAEAKGGVPVGTYKVEILAWRSSGGPAQASDGLVVGRTRGEQFLPGKFNKNSTLEITVEPGSSPITKNFDLTD